MNPTGLTDHRQDQDHAAVVCEKARQAFQKWRALSVSERVQYLRKLRLYMVEHLEQLVDEICRDTGKVPVEAITADILTVLDALRHTEKHAVHVLSERSMPTPILLFGKKSNVEYQPRGVVLVISPWNYPLQLAMVPLISALAAGNSVILKPSEVTPEVGRLIEKLFHESGFPQDVVQVVHGDGKTGAALVAQKPDYIFFTGSVSTGKKIQQEAAKHLIPTTLELGGKDPMIVCEDAPLERAVHGAIWGGITNSGQVCMSVERIYVHRSHYQSFVERMVEEVNKLREGRDGDDDVGRMTSSAQIEIVREHVQEALDRGARMVAGRPPLEWEGERIPPIVLVDVTPDMKIMREETFGPVLPVMPFDSEEEAVRLANDSPYGLSASVWSRDLSRAKKLASRIEAGNVVINDVIITVANHHLPFGGIKESGIGRYHGPAGLQIFCHQKSVMVDRGRRLKEVNWYPYRGKYPLFKRLLQQYFGERTDWFGLARSYLELLRKSR